MRLLTSADVLVVTAGIVVSRTFFFQDRPWTDGLISWAVCLALIAAIRVIINTRNP